MARSRDTKSTKPASPFPNYAREIRGRPNSWFLKADELIHCAFSLAEICSNAQTNFIEIARARNRERPSGREWSPAEGRLFALQRARRVPLMLVGLALENLLKGALIETDPNRAQDDKRWLKLTQGHSLQPLIKEVGIALGESEVEVCEALKEAVEWSGRYAVPKKEEDGGMQWSEEHGTHVPPGSRSGIDFEQALRLWNLVCEKVEARRPHRMGGGARLA